MSTSDTFKGLGFFLFIRLMYVWPVQSYSSMTWWIDSMQPQSPFPCDLHCSPSAISWKAEDVYVSNLAGGSTAELKWAPSLFAVTVYWFSSQVIELIPAQLYFKNATAYWGCKVANQYVGRPCHHKIFQYVTSIFSFRNHWTTCIVQTFGMGNQTSSSPQSALQATRMAVWGTSEPMPQPTDPLLLLPTFANVDSQDVTAMGVFGCTPETELELNLRYYLVISYSIYTLLRG